MVASAAIRSVSDELPLRGQRALITGAGGGIGGAIARELWRLGADLLLSGRAESALEQSRAALPRRDGQSAGIAILDITDAAAFAAAIDRARPSLLVNNAGAAASQPFHRMSEQHWQEMLNINLTGTFHGCRAAIPTMLQAGFGRIVNVASSAGQRGYPYVAAYCAAKHGVIGLTRALAAEYAGRNITVNAVCPGYVDTEMTRATIANIVAKTGRTPEQALSELVRDNPQGRLVRPEEVAEVVGWLCLPSAAAITGQAISVSGGEVMP